MTSGETHVTMAKKIELLETRGQICTEEYRTIPSYVYNWSAPVDKCCMRSFDIL